MKTLIVVLAIAALAVSEVDISLYRSHKHYADFKERKLSEIKQYECTHSLILR